LRHWQQQQHSRCSSSSSSSDDGSDIKDNNFWEWRCLQLRQPRLLTDDSTARVLSWGRTTETLIPQANGSGISSSITKGSNQVSSNCPQQQQELSSHTKWRCKFTSSSLISITAAEGVVIQGFGSGAANDVNHSPKAHSRSCSTPSSNYS
jgi:hypothetical protein